MDIFIQGYPRLGKNRELKTLVENYFTGRIDEKRLRNEARALEEERWKFLNAAGFSTVPVGDFSLYDTTLDTAFALGMIPAGIREAGLDGITAYFALARGYQRDGIDRRAWGMRKWFTTNYHYVIPEYEPGMNFSDPSSPLVDAAQRAARTGATPFPIIIGPLTFFELTVCDPALKGEFREKLLASYAALLASLKREGVTGIGFDESILVTDRGTGLSGDCAAVYCRLTAGADRPEIHVFISHGDPDGAVWDMLAGLEIDGIGLDLHDGPGVPDLMEKRPPRARTVYAGLVNGKNVWRTDYARALRVWRKLRAACPKAELIPASSCSLLHVPVSLSVETKLHPGLQEQLAFAEEKAAELAELRDILSSPDPEHESAYLVNRDLLRRRKDLESLDTAGEGRADGDVPAEYFSRGVPVAERLKTQQTRLRLPALPATTIGSFPQTADVRMMRTHFRTGQLSKTEYRAFLREKIKKVIALQEEIGLDVLVHGEYERNDMVEYFAEHFTGFAFTEKGWVQSYGVRAVKPPLIFGPVRRRRPISVDWIAYAQSLTTKPVKGMLTGPVTMYNWSFPGEHLDFRRTLYQIGLALREEIRDLEAAGISIIQVDEAALRERLPLRSGPRREDYLDAAVKAFRLATGGVKPETQIHTHMCYSDFGPIMEAVKALDADVITIEAAKSDLSILRAIKAYGYPAAIGPGVYDIHSPRVPSVGEIAGHLRKMLGVIGRDRLWVNPDCGLKTRQPEETEKSLAHMVAAARAVREEG
jgi:5-methyltetrahydropteroyltriglutamate--homocysteine methyltransferase